MSLVYVKRHYSTRVAEAGVGLGRQLYCAMYCYLSLFSYMIGIEKTLFHVLYQSLAWGIWTEASPSLAHISLPFVLYTTF